MYCSRVALTVKESAKMRVSTLFALGGMKGYSHVQKLGKKLFSTNVAPSTVTAEVGERPKL